MVTAAPLIAVGLAGLVEAVGLVAGAVYLAVAAAGAVRLAVAVAAAHATVARIVRERLTLYQYGQIALRHGP